MSRILHRYAAVIASALFLATWPACTFAAVQGAPQNGSQAASERVVTDDVGREVKVPAEVNRIVTLAPNLTEIVYALGLEDKLVGDTRQCDRPAAAKLKPHVGDTQNPSLETIVALHPDLVLATTAGNLAQTADALNRAGIPVYTSEGEAATVLGILDSISRLADVIGAKAHGDELVSGLRQRLDALHARLEDRPMVHVLFVVWLDPLITIGQNVFIADALRWAGAESIVTSRQNWPALNIEEVVRLRPDYIIFGGTHGGNLSGLGDLRSRPVWRDLDAVVTGHVIELGDDSIRPSPGLVDEIEALARKVHPEVFSQSDETHDWKDETRVALKVTKECDPCAR